MRTITLSVNGEDLTVTVEPRESLADVLRERLDLTGTHLGCEHGVCGACTIEVDGKATRACLILAVMAEGRRITTIEGLRDDPVAAVLRRHFHEQHALQCGFCTPGMLIMARDLLNRSTPSSEKDVREGLAGQMCRCTGYAGIVRAVLAAADETTSTRSPTP
ncbi:(2Fe-2S)-binding protein [Rhodoplanes roseus]|uniref:(2Fe-2S)-binding protein n=1 Tax=Rhodoplanes roseus TaxID=29409 RepID=A0A327KW67_9BRAD|nr:(2Fe-2S)-binding protein [Rhodoplanes roseus]RAI42541.1 (2Fe-2S)-binding protein [Rhodoplanes roseus]